MAADFDTMKSFISKIGPLVQKYAKQNGYKVASPIIAQACLESGYGTSYKAQFHNYFGLKYRSNRCPSACGTFVDGSKEQRPDGSYYDITDQWFKFKNMEDGVKGYFEFISIPNYDPVRQNITDPIKFVEVLGQCKYYTSLTYPQNIKRVINSHNLTQYDQGMNNGSTVPTIDPVKPTQDKKYYRVRTSWEDSKSQIGAYEKIENAKKECDKHPGYYVFDSDGKLVYPINNKTETKLEIGDKIKLLTDTYYNGKKIPAWVQKSTLYYRGEDSRGWKFSTKKSGAVTGVVKTGMLVRI